MLFKMELSLSKFAGSMMGALIGDCVGAPYENLTPKVSAVLDHLAHVKSPSYQGVLEYTDDTALTWALAESLVGCKSFVAKHTAESFTQTFFKKTNRGYGNFVKYVFEHWKKDKPKDIFEPARCQFNGQGSYGNGGGMRIAPVALFAAGDYDNMVDIAKQSTLLTHFHRDGYNGAILQCIAVWLALREDPGKPLDADRFVDSLIERMKAVEEISPEDSVQIGEPETSATPYTKKLETMKEFLSRDDVSTSEIIENLGHHISALKSIPTSIYAFLKATRPVPNFPVENPFERTIGLAITFGGDTDTIASMAGSIAGAYYGIEGIPIYMQTCCEEHQRAIKLAEQLYKVSRND